MKSHLNEERLLLYLDNALSLEARREVELHLMDCSSCQAELKLHIVVSAAYKKRIFVRPSADFTRKVMASALSKPVAPETIWDKLKNLSGIIFFATVFIYGLILSLNRADSSESMSLKLFRFFSEQTSNVFFQPIADFIMRAIHSVGIEYLQLILLVPASALLLTVAERFLLKRFPSLKINS